MEEKKVLKLGVSGFLLIIAIIAIAIMTIFICKLSKEKAEAELRASELQSQVGLLNTTINRLNNDLNEQQRKLNTISETINSSPKSENSIIGKWQADKAFDAEGNELGLNAIFGSGIHMSNEMEFKENGSIQYNISITASSDDGEYTVEGNTIKYGVPTDTKGVLNWHTATYNPADDTIQEEIVNEGRSVIFTRIK